ncbi:MAG TPA: response regulator transcription factor [Fimbriimonadales bacterium]|jgi:DNA-binding NarL/FixJ family response regulator|nr:response regulator transcription factor [Fimbriimonadales bacterium]
MPADSSDRAKTEKVVVAETSLLAAEGVAAVLQESGLQVSGVAADVRGLRKALRSRPDVVVADARYISELGRTNSPVPIVLLEDAPAGKNGRPSGVALRNEGAKNLVGAVRAALSGKSWRPEERSSSGLSTRGTPLSSRERQVAELVAQGNPNRKIAQMLDLSEQSVKNLVSRILKKKGYANRVQIALDLWSRPETRQ